MKQHLCTTLADIAGAFIAIAIVALITLCFATGACTLIYTLMG